MFDTLFAARKNVSTSGNIPYPTPSGSETTDLLAKTDNISLLGNSQGDKLNLNNHLTGCICEGCRSTYVNLESLEPLPVMGATLSVASVPLRSSNPGAPSKLFLDFNGHTTSGTLWNTNFNGGANIVTPAYSIDADPTTFSTGEIASIEEIWRRVAEDYAPFNVDVTTIDPGNLNGPSNTRAVIGGSWNQWYEESGGAGGVAYVNSWQWNSDTPVFVFEDNLGNGAAKYTAEAISHEAGHSLGLRHQSRYDGSGNKIDEYNPGSGSGDTGWAPIMGVSYYKNLTTWHYGTSSLGSTVYQDDMNVISAANNGFGGYRSDDRGNTIYSATALSGTATLTGSGIISQTSDTDVFSFAAGAGPLNLTINPAPDGPNLDIVADLMNSSGTIIASSNPASNLFANLNTPISAGNYFLAVKSNQDYGRVGQYTISGTVTPAPSVVNDNFSNRIYLGGLPVSTTGSNIGATGEAQEPAQSGSLNSAWWSWTAPSTGIVNFDTLGSNFDTYLSLFTGYNVGNLTFIAADDDGAGYPASRITRNVTAGETYQIAVDGFYGNTGQIQLNISAPPPPNDNFVNRIALTGNSATSTGSNHGATGEVNEPAQSGVTNSAWWSWTAASSGFFQVDTIGSNSSSDSDTYLSVFKGSALNSLTLLGANDDGGGNLDSLVNVNATPGQTYQIAVDGWSGRTGPIDLNIAPTAPPNDNFANRITLTGATANATGSNIRATGEVGEPTQSGTTNSVWWTWTAPSTGIFKIDTINSGYDTWLSLFTGNNVSGLSLVATDDDSGGNGTSRINLNAIGGQTYQIAVDGWSNSIGQINLNIGPPTASGSGKLSETANNTLKPEKDLLTGADTTSAFPPSSARAPVADFANIEKTDILTEGGSTINAPILLSPAVNTAVPLLEKVDPMFTEPNGALAEKQALGITTDPFGVAQTSPSADRDLLGIYNANPFGI